MNRRTMLGLLAALPTAIVATRLPAQTAPVFSSDGAAIRGYDPVAYFTEGKPVEGAAEHALRWKGADWHFASAENRATFEANPEKYAPQYGGYCAYAVAQGDLVSIDPEAWKVRDGKLYLNYSQRIQRRWEKDIPGYIESADAEWPRLVN